MTRKVRILHELGEQAFLLPSAMAEGFTANDDVKSLFTALQVAREHADLLQTEPGGPMPEPSTLEAGGTSLDLVAADTRLVAPGIYRIPRARELHDRIVRGIEAMVAPLELAGDGRASPYRARLQTLLGQAPDLNDDLVPGEYISAMVRARRGTDSLHRLVMDLHRELNDLQADLAEDVIDGARVYGLLESDRPLVRAFMAGLNATAHLKFSHPGLETTATRSGTALLLQNDIGTTEAHILLVRVAGLTACLTHTDVHADRARFFRDVLGEFSINWTEHQARAAAGFEEPSYVQLDGVFEAASSAQLEKFLARLGSRIVFLIDWNRARHALHAFLRRSDAVAILRWAADHDLGHRAFLQAGGERMVAEAIDQAARAPLRYGERLDGMIGGEAAIAYLQAVLRLTAEGIQAGRSDRLIRSQVLAELVPFFHSEEETFLGLLEEHATLLVDLAQTAREALQDAHLQTGEETLQRHAQRARGWEHAADLLVDEARRMRASRRSPFYGSLLSDADAAANALEEAVFLISQLPAVTPLSDLATPLEALASLVADATQEMVKAVLAAAALQATGSREDNEDFLEAVDRLVTLEHEMDEAERQLQADLLRRVHDFQQERLISSIAAAFERAADVLSRTALELSDRVVSRANLQ